MAGAINQCKPWTRLLGFIFISPLPRSHNQLSSPGEWTSSAPLKAIPFPHPSKSIPQTLSGLQIGLFNPALPFSYLPFMIPGDKQSSGSSEGVGLEFFISLLHMWKMRLRVQELVLIALILPLTLRSKYKLANKADQAKRLSANSCTAYLTALYSPSPGAWPPLPMSPLVTIFVGKTFPASVSQWTTADSHHLMEVPEVTVFRRSDFGFVF